MYCTKCGSKVVNEALFCIKCGHRLININPEAKVKIAVSRDLNSQESPTSPKEYGKKKKGVPNALLLVALITVALVTAFYILLQNPNTGLGKAPYNMGNSAHNLGQGGLVAVHGNWIFYANPNFNGALFAREIDNNKPLQLTHFPVANLNISDDCLVFTDIYGSYIIEKKTGRSRGVYDTNRNRNP